MVELVEPAHLWVPSHTSTAGGEVAQLAEMAGLTLDPEQRLAIDSMLVEVREDGRSRWAALEACIIAARQNLKTFTFQVLALADLFLFDVELVIWSAHLFSTAQEAFRNLDAIIAGTPYFASRIKRVDRANGEEGFELNDGRRLKFRARSKTGGRGLTGDVVYLDEALALTASEMGSLIPTMSARPNPHIRYGSSAGLITSDILRTIRDRGRARNDEQLVYLEWCAPVTKCADPKCDHYPGADECALDDEELWRYANPALDRRITRRFVRGERRMLPPAEFARERLGWWEDPVAGASGIGAEDWELCGDRTAALDEPVALAIDVAPGSSSAAIVACGDALHVVKAGRGTGWLVDELVQVCGEHEVIGVGLDPAGPAAALLPELVKAGFRVRDGEDDEADADDGDVALLDLLDARAQVRACESFLVAVHEHKLVHRDEGALNAAVAGAGRRPVGDSWKWSRRDSAADISPLVAATVARWLHLQYVPEGDPEPFFFVSQ